MNDIRNVRGKVDNIFLVGCIERWVIMIDRLAPRLSPRYLDLFSNLGLRKGRSMETEDTLLGNPRERLGGFESSEGTNSKSGVESKAPNIDHPSECLPCRILIAAAALGKSWLCSWLTCR